MNTDELYMIRCFEIAMNGAGHVSPNPMVGAVIVKNNQVISTGYHSKYGEVHAEVNAIKNSKENVNGSVLYCNLEPCIHLNKQTPPCVPSIISSGIKKVVISNIDPNPFVSGKGIQELISNSIEVITGVLEEEGKELNKFFFKYIKTGLPYVTLKIASSSDGNISRSRNEQTWLTSHDSQIFVHQKRSIYDAILIGANTVNVDNPELTVREIKGRNPVRIILDGNFSSSINSKLFNDKKSRTIIIGSSIANEKKKNEFRDLGIEVIEIEPENESKLNLMSIMEKISELKIASLLVEGGGEVFTQFINNNLADEIFLLEAPIKLESGYKMPSFEYANYVLKQKEKIGKDLLSVYKKS